MSTVQSSTPSSAAPPPPQVPDHGLRSGKRANIVIPRYTPHDKHWMPVTDAQQQMLDSEADIGLFGGAAGSLKSGTLLMGAASEWDLPRMRGIIFRRSFPELEELIDQSRMIYAPMGAKYNESKHIWTFPAGGTIKFRYIQRDNQKYQYQGHQYSYLGFDESTHFSESIVRYMLTRVRSTDPGMFIRTRLATNPGNVGHDWHKKLFLNNICPHCEPDKAPESGALYFDRRWPSDKTPLSDLANGLKIGVTFVPGSIADHNLLGARYTQLLKMQNPAVAKALLAGCWQIFEGQYFDLWEPNRGGEKDPAMRMVQDWRNIGYQWWWPHWVGADYGFSISHAVAYLYTRRPPYTETLPNGLIRHWPNGRRYILSEYHSQHEKASTFTESLIRKWVLDRDGKRIDRRFNAWYLSPDAWQNKGIEGKNEGEHTLAAQMNKVLGDYGFYWEKAKDDRAGGAMRMYTGFDTGELVVCSNCKLLLDSLPSRVHDPDKENDVLKVKSDSSGMDDAYDAARYGDYSYEFTGERPAEDRVAEAMDQTTDVTSAMIRRAQVMKEIKEEAQPTVYGGRNLIRGNQRRRTSWNIPKK